MHMQRKQYRCNKTILLKWRRKKKDLLMLTPPHPCHNHFNKLYISFVWATTFRLGHQSFWKYILYLPWKQLNANMEAQKKHYVLTSDTVTYIQMNTDCSEVTSKYLQPTWATQHEWTITLSTKMVTIMNSPITC